MQHTFAADGTYSSTKGFYQHKSFTSIIVGTDADADFGGGTLNIIMQLENGATKIIESRVTADDNSEPIFFNFPSVVDLDFQLTGSTTPDLTIEVQSGDFNPQ